MVVPGLAFGMAARLRGLALAAFAPVASTAILATIALLFGLCGIPWSPWTAAGAAAVVVLAVWGFRVLVRPSPVAARWQPGAHWIVPAGIAVGTVLAALRLALYIGEPQNVSQTNDAVFHLNALRYILESGSASSLDITGMLDISSFYPAAWHAPTSLVAMSTDADLVVVANAMTIVIGALVWTSGIAWLTSVATDGNRLAAAAAASLSAALVAFPLLMIQWGVLYPALLAIALLPAAVAAAIDLPRRLRGSERNARDAVWGALLILVGVAAVALAHPSLLLAWGLLVVSFAVWWIGGRWRSATLRQRAAMLIAALASVFALAAVWFVMGGLVTGEWPHSRGRIQALADILINSQLGFPAAWGVSILMIVGLIVCARAQALRWLATAWVLIACLYFVAVAVGNPAVRAITGPFYDDPYRIAALVPVVVIPLAGIGVSAVATWAQNVLRARSKKARRPDPGTTAAAWTIGVMAAFGAVSLAVAPVIQWRDVWSGAVDHATWYQMDESSYLSVDELALLERLPQRVPADQLVLGNPSTGMAFGYALGEHAVYPKTWQPPRTQAYEVLAGNLNAVATDPLVCPALDAIGSRYVLDFGPGDADYGHYVLPGFTGLAEADGFELVDREGQASLWRVTACD
ncbi:DUF6541 family protein [Microbacterium sp. zg.B48]|uniref:DUF6541 family protein n=1 Tax=Microbacterium sp. zg.B48 TaxID=2969408 RepID=UPI00214C946C|nr:DUF6541 family protein [Microbacterium sp. zg.B48]